MDQGRLDHAFRRPARRAALAALLLATLGCFPLETAGFPPYRSTDAEAAEPGTLEARLGLFRLEHDDGESERATPLLRLNLGLTRNLELVSELEYSANEDDVTDAAVGLKWASSARPLSVGFEALALLPVSAAGGAGSEGTLLVTYRRDTLRVHVNAGAFYDGRPSPIERGWRASALGELRTGRVRPGLELAAKQVAHERAQLVAGTGVIVDLGRFDVCAGIHAGLSRAAPDVVTSLWISAPFSLY